MCRWHQWRTKEPLDESEKVGLKLNIQKTKIMTSDPMANRWGNSGRLYFFGAPKLLQMVTATMKLKEPWKESYDQPRQQIEKQGHYFANKSPSSQDYGFSSSHVWMWELDYKESWAPKNWCFWTVEKTFESPLGCKEIQPVHPKGNKSWIFTGRTDVEAEPPILWPCDEMTHLKRPWCWERLEAGGEGDDRGWDGWMAIPTWWRWVLVNSGSWWWTGRSGVLQFMGSQRVDVTEQLNWLNDVGDGGVGRKWKREEPLSSRVRSSLGLSGHGRWSGESKTCRIQAWTGARIIFWVRKPWGKGPVLAGRAGSWPQFGTCWVWDAYNILSGATGWELIQVGSRLEAWLWNSLAQSESLK